MVGAPASASGRWGALMRILFTSPHALLDPASGAAHSMRTLLERLALRGHRVGALTGMVQDGLGAPAAFGQLRAMAGEAGQAGLLHGTLAGVEHRVLRQRSTRLAALPAAQEAALHRQWRRWLRDARPDAVLTFGGMLYSRAVLAQARSAGIRTAFYLAAPGYRDRAAFDDADLVFAVSSAVAEENGLAGDPRVRLISSLIDLDRYRVQAPDPQYVLFVNPQAAKGVAVFAAVAELSERLGRPHRFLVVESRGTWASAVAHFPSLKERGNVTVLQRQDDMRAVYRVARTVMFPSLWFEAAGRVVREAGASGIPVIAHRVGGVAETVPEGLRLLDPPQALLDDWMAPVPDAFARAWLDELDRMHDDGAHRADHSARIRRAVQGYSLDRLVDLVERELGARPVQQRAGAGPGASVVTPHSPLRRILCVGAPCVLDGSSSGAAALRAQLEALAARGHDVRVLCGSLLEAPEAPAAARLLERAPRSGTWLADSAHPQRIVRGGLLRGVRYRVLCFGSNRSEDLLSVEMRMLFLALLDIERGWTPQALVTIGDGLLPPLLRHRARVRGLPVAHWGEGDGLQQAGLGGTNARVRSTGQVDLARALGLSPASS